MDLTPEDLVKILAALAVGGAVGIEREFHDKAAGFRTLICICLGSALFTILSIRIAGPAGDPGRIASYIVAGIGFLGGGVILRDGGQIKGLTTAATVWLVAALGIGVGAGYYGAVALTTVLAIVVLWAFPWVERGVDRLHNERTYEVASRVPDAAAAVEALFGAHGLRVISRRETRSGDRRTWTWKTAGRLASQRTVTSRLLDDATLEDVRFS